MTQAEMWIIVIIYVFLGLLALYNAYRSLIKQNVNFSFGLILGLLIGLGIDFARGTFERGEPAQLPGYGAIFGWYFLNRKVKGGLAIVIGLCWLAVLLLLIWDVIEHN